MKTHIKVISIALGLLAIMFFICTIGKPKVFIGYVVGKSKHIGYWSNNQSKVINYASPVIIPITHTNQKPTWHETEYYVHCANIEELKHFKVDSALFFSTKVLDKKSFVVK